MCTFMLIFSRFSGRFVAVRIFFLHRNQEAAITRISPELVSVFLHASFFSFFVGGFCIQDTAKSRFITV